jgi:rhodanese-related sulfurtransferase
MTSRLRIRTIAALAVVAAAPITLAACGGGDSASSGGGAAVEVTESASTQGTLGAVSVQQAHDQLDKGTAVMVDVREPDELAESSVPGTIDIPLGQLEARASEIPTGKPVLVFCRSGNRSQEGAAILAAKGYDASTVEGGIIAWQDAGLPTT